MYWVLELADGVAQLDPTQEDVRQARKQRFRGTRALFILGGLVSVAFGVVLFARPGVGAVTLALLFGRFSLIYGSRRSPWASSCARPGSPCTQSWRMRPDLARGRGRPRSRPQWAPAQRLPGP